MDSYQARKKAQESTSTGLRIVHIP